MSHFMAEFIGTAILILLGGGVCANCSLTKSNGKGGGWIVITAGWSFAVLLPAVMFGSISGAHFNPALTIALAAIGKFPWNEVGTYVVAQMLGAIVGATLVWLAYLPHWKETEDKGTKLGIFCTGPAIRNLPANALTEVIATGLLVFLILGMGAQKLAPGLGTMFVGNLIWALGLSLGGPTGYALNPARDLGPRIAHAILPIAGKGDSNWSYAWVPVVGPVVGALLGVFVAVF